ncbi:MAG: small multi-drug export protein [Desulfotignum sp.]|nr:small multi-drug export protein [Desulfotignum sp.]MCF8114189.1 small multi-drug export protein [Desulfotignum sp.]MCF8126792.1 small multi-drug export protein [Desulfotignum sp.]
MQHRLINTVEGKLLLVGLLLAIVLLGTIIFCGFTDFETARTLVLVFIAHSIGGRAAGIGLCILQDLGTFSTIFYNFYLEFLIVCFTYAVFVLSATQYLRVEWLTRIMENIGFKALKNKEKIERFGWLGIFFFVMAPLPVTGPVVGSIIGYMLRLSLLKNFSATFSGTLTAIILWFQFFDFLEDRFHMIQYIFAFIVFLVLIVNFKKIKRFVQAITRKAGSINKPDL